jgi:hypothetical protein
MLASGTEDRGFAPDRSRRIFPAGKNYSMPSFGRGSKIICPMLVTSKLNVKKGQKGQLWFKKIKNSRWCHYASENSMCPGSIQPLKNEYQDIHWGKDSRCVRLTTYHFQVPMSRNLERLTSQNPLGPIGL